MESTNIQQNNYRLIKNTIAMYARTFIVMILSLYITRVVLQKLGVEDYGVYNVVGTIVVLFTFLNATLSQTVQQFITIEHGAGTTDSIVKVFNMSILVQTVIAIAMIILCETIGLYIVNTYLDVGDKIVAANYVYQFSIVTAVVNIFRVPFEALIVANEKMTFYAMASVGDAIMKVIIVLLIPSVSSNKLIVYAGLLALVFFISFLIYVVYCRVKFPTCKFRKSWDKDVFRRMMNFSGWSLSGSITNMATLNVFGVLLNIFYGVVANAALGIMNQVNAAIIQFINNFQTSFRPQIVKAYAAGENDYFMKLLSTASKFSYLLMFIPGLLLIVNMPLVLNLWLREYPLYTVAFCRLIIICCMFDALTGAYYCAISATGNIKRYQMCISCSFLLDLLFSIVMMVAGVRPEYILYSRIATRGILNMWIGLIEMKKLVNFDLRGYFKAVIFPMIVLTLLLSLVCCVIIQYFKDWQLLLISFVLIIVPLLLSYRFILTKSELNNIKLLFDRFRK